MWLKVIHNQKTFTFIIYTKQKIEKEYLEKRLKEVQNEINKIKL